MAIRNVVKEGDEILAKVSRPVEKFDEKLHTLLDDMAETMYSLDGAGLAAVQVGILRRVVVIDVGDGLIELINPQIIKQSGVQNNTEGCLSCPGKWGITERPMKVTVQAQDRFGKKFKVSGDDLMARALCHELDHLDGHLFLEKCVRMLDPEEMN